MSKLSIRQHAVRAALWLYGAMIGGVAVLLAALAFALFNWPAVLVAAGVILFALLLPVRYSARALAGYLVACLLNFAALVLVVAAVALGVSQPDAALWALVPAAAGWLLLHVSRGVARASALPIGSRSARIGDSRWMTGFAAAATGAWIGTEIESSGSQDWPLPDRSTDDTDRSRHEFTDISGDMGTSHSEDFGVTNPATGLPMIGGTGGVDVMGNPYGFDDSDRHSSTVDDDWMRSGSNSFD